MGDLESKTVFESFLEKTIDTDTRWFNWKLGLSGGTFSGMVNYFVNNAEGIIEGLWGGGVQFLFNFTLGGANSKFCQYLSQRFDNTYLAVTMASVFPTTVSFGVNYLWHKVLGSAEPFNSSVWQIPLNALFGDAIGYRWHIQGKNQKLKNSQNL